MVTEKREGKDLMHKTLGHVHTLSLEDWEQRSFILLLPILVTKMVMFGNTEWDPLERW